jgi:hypothetical protein
MPDFGSPVAAGVNVDPNKGLTTLGDLLGLTQKQQAIQSGQLGIQQQQQAIQGTGMQLQAQTQANTERQALVQLMQDPNSGVFNDDGSPNLAVATKKIMSVAPQTGADMVGKLTALSTNHSQAMDASSAMTDKERARVSGMATALDAIGANPTQIKAAYDYAASQYSDPNLKKYLQATSSTIGMMPPDTPPDVVRGTLQKVRAAMMPADEQQTTYAPKPGFLEPGETPKTGAELNPNRLNFGAPNGVNVAPQVGISGQQSMQPSNVPGAPPVIVTKAPTSGQIVSASSAGALPSSPQGADLNQIQAQRRYLMDQAQRPENQNPTTQDSIKALMQKLDQQASGGGAFEQLPPGENAQTRDALTAARGQANAQAAQAGNLASNNKQILQILDGGTTTGSNAGYVQKVMGAIGLNWSNSEADNLNQLGHYLALQAQANEKAMGVHTDAGAQTAGLASGTITMTPAALKSAVKANDALVTGSQAFNTGLEAAIQKSGSIFAARQFQNDWARNFDPIVFRYANAIRDGDAAEKAKIEQQYGKPAAGQKMTPQWSTFVGKMQKLDQLESGQ